MTVAHTTLQEIGLGECADRKRVPELRRDASVHFAMSQSHQRVDSEWVAALRAHDFARAWAINESDLAHSIAENRPKHEGPRHLQHIWRGEPLAGARVLVRCYHGLGDTLQFIRFATPLRKIAREVIVWTQPELLPMVEQVPGVDRALPLHDGTPDVDYDVDIEVMELAFALRATRGMIERVPYLQGDSRLSRFEHPPTEREIHIGLVWRAGNWDTRRSLNLQLLAPLAETGARLHLLQPLTEVDRPVPFAATDDACAGIPAVAATISKLDLILTVDTMMAHLAGALALPVWTMLCHACDWRWGEGPTTPWYPTMRLFRQTRAGDWRTVISEIADKLATTVRERTEERPRRKEVFATKELTS